MNTIYIPVYKSEVQQSTFDVRKKTLENIRDRFYSIPLRLISIEDVQRYRIWLLNSEDDGGAGYAQSYASLIFGMFRKSLDRAVELQYLDFNISKKVKAIPKGKAIVPFWTKTEFEKVIREIHIDNFYEHLNFAMLWVYYMTGVRVNEGTALYWNDIDLSNNKMHVHHMLIFKNKQDWRRNYYTKTEDGKRTIALDNDTVSVLKAWRKHQQITGLGNENDFVFSYDGLPMQRSTISRIIARYAGLAKVKRIQAKGLRHSRAS